MDVLVVAPYLPYPPRFGGAARVFHLVRVLSRAHRVTLLCFASAAEAAGLGPLRAMCELAARRAAAPMAEWLV
jgi:hypothetical protein